MCKQLICDQQLVSEYINGDEAALSEIVDRHKHKVFEFILTYVKEKEKAEDLFQETFFKVITTIKKGGYNEQGKFLPWVLRIAHHLIMDTYRAKKRHVTITTLKNDAGKEVEIFDVLVVPDQTHENNLVKTQLRKKLRNLIRHLDKEQREVIILRHYFGMSFREIAERKDMSINTALGRMHYALLNLNKIIKEQKIDFGREMQLQENFFIKKEIF